MKYAFYFLFSLSCFLTSCKTLPFESMVLSQGGGFTGAETQYFIDKKGHVFLQNNKTEETEKLGRLKRSQKNEMITLFELLKTMPMVDEPSNMTRRLVVSDTIQAIQNIWPVGKSNTGGHEAVYIHIMNTINNLKK